jgi:predicted transcriptional regulator
MNRERTIAAINTMPLNFKLEELMEKLVFIEKIEKGLEQLKSGDVISHAQVKERISKWHK